MRPILILLLATSLTACNPSPDPKKGESPIIRKPFNFSGFDRINVRGPDSVIVTRGPRFSIVAEGQKWGVGALDVKQNGLALDIGRARWLGPTGAGAADRPVLVRITLPALAGATLTGSGGMSVDAVAGNDLSLMLTGSGGLTVSKVAVKRLLADVTGSGNIRLSGRADNGFLSSQGAGSIDAARVHIGTVSVSVLGAGGVKVASDGIANVSMLGSGEAVILGRPHCTVSRTGAGTVRCGE